MTTKAESTLQVLRSEERGHANHGWLDTYHSFSFGNYYNPKQMGFRSLRVINQDIIDPGAGFPTHPHRDMEIFTYMLSGELKHRDSMGNEEGLLPGQIQLMSAGSGITHSEFNGSHTEAASLLQIWIMPEREGLTPSYTDWTPSESQKEAKKSLIISPDGREQSATIHQDALIYRIKLKAGESITHSLTEGRGAWIQLIDGKLTANNVRLQMGDASFTEESGEISLIATEDSEALLFDLN
jgi:redox-sensitive bicupin YhaK (pirin superfamily)